MKDYLRLVNIDTEGDRNDITPIFGNQIAFRKLTEDLAKPFRSAEIDLVAGIDALGFILGTAVAFSLGVGFLPVRKGGKLPTTADKLSFVDYTGKSKSLELRAGSIIPGQQVLIVDEWVETGAQMRAALELIKGQGAVVSGIAAINIDDSIGGQWLREHYYCHTVWDLD